MTYVVLKAGILICIILLGYLLNNQGVFSQSEDFATISKLIMYVTLPSTIITKLNNLNFHYSFLLIAVFGFLCNWIYIFVSKFIGKTKKEQSFLMLNLNGYSIGSFALPFISYFLNGLPILFVSLFDAGSAVMSSSGNYTAAKATVTSDAPLNLEQDNKKNSIISYFKTTISSPPVFTYLVMIILSIFSISLPTVLIDFTSIIGNANTFLSMFMIGIALDLQFDLYKIGIIVKILVVRYGVAMFLSGIIYFFLPLTIELKQTLIIILHAPIASLSTIFTKKLGQDVGLSAQVNSASIIISIIIMSVFLSQWV